MFSGSSLDAKACSKCGAHLPAKGCGLCRDKANAVPKVVSNDLAKAREVETLKKADNHRGEFNIKRKPKEAPTLEEVWATYLKWAQIPGNKKTWITDKFNYRKHLEPRFGKKRLDVISGMDVNRMKLEMTKGEDKDGKPCLSKQGRPIFGIHNQTSVSLAEAPIQIRTWAGIQIQGRNPF